MLKDNREGSELQAEVASAPAQDRACSVSGCGGRYLARGFCIKHYYQVKRHGEVRSGAPSSVRRHCKEEGCGGSSYALGYCSRHYRQNWRTAAPVRRPAPILRDEHRCRDGACPESPFSQGLCRLHYIMTRYQDLVT